MNIEKHISELLFEHDCVIVPDFGGFVCNYSSATIHAGKNQFQPPFKKISFNRNLKNNDGLLANQISQEEKISYSDANHLISESVESLNKELNSNKRFEFKNIGTFFLGEENTLSFEQNVEVNYLPESFGFAVFYSPAIKREPLERKVVKQLQDKKIIPSKTNKETGVVRKRIPIRRYIAVATFLLIFASLIFVSVQTNFLKNVNIANLNPFAAKTEMLYHSSEIAFPDIKNENVNSLLANANDTMRYLNIVIGGKIPIVVSLLEDKTVVKKTTNHKLQTTNRFNIIGGAFSVPENAKKFLAKLKSLGYDAQIINKKLQMVSYGGFATREEALQALEKIRTVQSDVWLMMN